MGKGAKKWRTKFRIFYKIKPNNNGTDKVHNIR